ncbi:MAG: aromatic amino acid lyase [Hyphomonadaceae bacterium]|nr:aromatic amino acid lyase [Hyphomonadaceae bacterium]
MVTISGEGLSIDDIAAVARGAKVEITKDRAVLDRVERSRQKMADAIAAGQQVYGVTTLYGAMADRRVPPERMRELQRIALWHHKAATGPRLTEEEVRAAMLLRANTLLKGASSVRVELIERLATFLNQGASPHVYQRGSIGASGDLGQLSYIGASIVGLDPAFLVDYKGETLDCVSALKKLGLKPLELEPKEGLALNNGTAASTAVAANAMARAYDVFALGLALHALFAQTLLATSQSFDEIIHRWKPHPGQIWIAAQMRGLIAGSKLIRSEAAGDRGHRAGALVQDRYALRCLPQYMGPIIDGIAMSARQVEVEANSANDNPLNDPDTGEVYHTGNFLAQYTAVAMDQLRYHLGMLVKHLDVQIAMLVSPEFNHGLPPSLVGNPDHGLNIGLKSLQVGCNALAPLVGFYGGSMADRYPTHAEQYNQNINSQAMNSANIARDSVEACEHFMANALLFAIQGAELRAKAVADTHDPSPLLSAQTRGLYQATRTAAVGPRAGDRPVIWDDTDGFIQPKVEGILSDIRSRGAILTSIEPLRGAVRAFAAEGR